MLNRRNRVNEILRHKNLDGMIVYSSKNRRYLSGFTGYTGYVVLSSERLGLITDFRFFEQACLQCKGFDIIKSVSNIVECVADTIKKYGIRKLAFEDAYMSVSFYEQLKEKLGDVEMVPLGDITGDIRIIKDEEELNCIKKAAQIADSAFSHILEYIKPGVTEKDIALELEYFMKKEGASGNSFNFIIASGIRSSLPYGIATNKKINSSDFLTMDFGCVYNGYCSDMTRTVVIGKANQEQKKIYDIVLKAQVKALGHIKSGVLCKDADKIARDIISDEGYGNNFGHGLGHGVGLAIHEEPRLFATSKRALEKNMVVTVEPGIYITGFGGVRIEDLVVVGENSPIVLSKSSKGLIEL